jgi:hypothetical protein
MRRGVPLLLSLAFSGCGARTGLADEIADAAADFDADDRTETRAPPPGPNLCPQTHPVATAACETRASSVLCAYLDGPPGGIEAWCCEFGGWVNCTTVANTAFTTCSEVVCTPDVYVECIRAERECCTCSADMTADACGPC